MILSTNMITNIPAPDLTSFFGIFAIGGVIFFTDQRKKDGSDFESDKISSFQKTPLHIGEQILTVLLVLRHFNMVHLLVIVSVSRLKRSFSDVFVI